MHQFIELFSWKSGRQKFHSYLMVVFSSRVDLLLCVRLQLTGWILSLQALTKRMWCSCTWKGQVCIFMLQLVMVVKSICAHQELSANLTNVTFKRILLVRFINIFFISTYFVEVCNVVVGTYVRNYNAHTVSLVHCRKITGVAMEYLYRKLRPFFASKPALM